MVSAENIYFSHLVARVASDPTSSVENILALVPQEVAMSWWK